MQAEVGASINRLKPTSSSGYQREEVRNAFSYIQLRGTSEAALACQFSILKVAGCTVILDSVRLQSQSCTCAKRKSQSRTKSIRFKATLCWGRSSL